MWGRLYDCLSKNNDPRINNEMNAFKNIKNIYVKTNPNMKK